MTDNRGDYLNFSKDGLNVTKMRPVICSNFVVTKNDYHEYYK